MQLLFLGHGKSAIQVGFSPGLRQAHLGRRAFYLLQQVGQEGDLELAGQEPAHGPDRQETMPPLLIGRYRYDGIKASRQFFFYDLQVKRSQERFQGFHFRIFVQDNDLAQGVFVSGIGDMAQVWRRLQQAGTADFYSAREEFAAAAAANRFW